MKHSSRRISLPVALAATVLGVAHAVSAAPPTFEGIGPLDSDITDMSADGSVIVGSFLFGPPSFHWTREGGTKFIGGNGRFVKVSDDGSVISGNTTVNGHNEAALWIENEVWQPLGGLGTTGCPDFSNNYNISGNGQVVVGLGWNGCIAHAFRWEQSTGMVDLGHLGPGTASRANDTNFDGSVVVGWDDGLSQRRGARWVNGVESLLIDNTDPGIYLGEAQAVTSDGSIIVGGEAGPTDGPFYDEGYIWTEEKGGELIGKLSGGLFATTHGLAVTDDGRLVAGSSGPQFKLAFVWTEETGILNFQNYLLALGVTGLEGWTLGGVSAMSSDGTKLAGWGLNPDARSQGWLVENMPMPADFDGDAVFDPIDNCTDIANTDQRDTNGDGFGNLCDPDLNNDFVVNFLDLAIFSTVFLTADGDADFNGDGSVNFIDLTIFREYFLGVPGPSGQVP